jgi:hypothetical protein
VSAGVRLRRFQVLTDVAPEVLRQSRRDSVTDEASYKLKAVVREEHVVLREGLKKRRLPRCDAAVLLHIEVPEPPVGNRYALRCDRWRQFIPFHAGVCVREAWRASTLRQPAMAVQAQVSIWILALHTPPTYAVHFQQNANILEM